MAEERTLQSLLAKFHRYGDEPALIWFSEKGSQNLSFSELEDRVLRAAGGLLARGVGPGKAAAVMSRNRPEAIVARLAVVASGAMLVSLDHELEPDEISRQLRDSRCRVIFTTGDFVDVLRLAKIEALKIVVLDAEGEAANGVDTLSAMMKGDRLESFPKVSGDDVVALFYTSGTTGMPKGVPLTHRNILCNVEAVLAQNVIQSGERVLLPLPLYHSYPFIIGMLTPLSAGTAIVLPEGVSGPQIVRALREGNVKTVVGVPRLYEALYNGIEGWARARGYLAAAVFRLLLGLSLWLRRRFGVRLGRYLLRPLHAEFAPKLRVLASGGAKLNPEVAWRLEGLGWKVLCGYGLVETASIATFNPRDGARIGSAGLPAPGVEMKLDQPDEQGRGEVLFRGPNVFSGYRNNPEANRQAFTEDGWFRTGDLGVTDGDGYLFIVGRVKEMIITAGGKNVAPEEVESAYAQSEYIREVAVVDRDGSLVALVVPELEAVKSAGSGRIEDLIRVSFGELAQRLPTYKRLSDFVITREPLPRTHLGKYRRHELPPIYERAERGEPPPAPELSAADQALLERPRASRAWQWLTEQFPDRIITPDTNPQLELGIDSLAWVNLSMDLENRLGVSLSEEAIARVTTVRDLLEEVENAPAAGEEADRAGEEARARIMADRERWFAPPGMGGLAVSWLLYGAVWLAARLLFRLRTKGRDRVPTSGPLVITPNHASDLDPFVLGAALSFGHLRRTYWGADADRVFGTWLGRRLSRVVHLFPVHDRAPGASLDMAAEVLRRGHILIWFPEEFRSPTGKLQRFLPGIGKILEREQATVLPAYISGTFEAMPRNRRLPRVHPVTVRFGQPIAADRLEATGEGEAAYVRITDALRNAVQKLEAGGTGEPSPSRAR